MKIYRSPDTEVQLAESISLRSMLTDHLVRGFKSGAEEGGNNNPLNPFFQTIKRSAEGFLPELTRIAATDVDRTVSMLAGPFFTNLDYPIPTTSRGMLLPIVQLDLREISELSGRPLGDGLLQLWCDPEWANDQRGLVRVIPRDEICIEAMTNFDYTVHPASSHSPIPDELKFEPPSGVVCVFNGYRSIGLQCQTSYLLDVYGYDVPDDILNPIVEHVERFEELTACERRLHVLGSFYPIQYSAVDIDGDCLIEFPNWGSNGSAQVIYKLCTHDEVVFWFEESLR